jgi:hypothetical protein
MSRGSRGSEQCARNNGCIKVNKHIGACNFGGKGEATLFLQFVALKQLPDEQRVRERMLLAVDPEVKQNLESAKACHLQAADTYEEMRGQGNKVNALSARFEGGKAHTSQIHAELVEYWRSNLVRLTTFCETPRFSCIVYVCRCEAR